MYNALRLLFLHSKQPLDCFWLSTITEDTINDRIKSGHHILIKTHAFSAVRERVTHIIITHRDLRQVVSSYRRMNWEWNLPEHYVEDHMKWKSVADLDVALEDIVSQPERVLESLVSLFQDVSPSSVPSTLKDVSNLPIPKEWVDPVTQVWPGHLSESYIQKRNVLKMNGSGALTPDLDDDTSRHGPDDEALNDIRQRYPLYFEMYNYR